MDIHAILVRSPVNGVAARVVSQAGCEGNTPLSREELCQIHDRLQRKHRLLKHVLGIKNKSQHSNLMVKFNRRLPQYRAANEPRAFTEYVRVGREMQRMCRALADMRAERRAAAAAEQHESSPTASGS